MSKDGFRVPMYLYGMLQDFSVDNKKIGYLRAPEEIPWHFFDPGMTSHLDFLVQAVIPKHQLYEDCLNGIVQEDGHGVKVAQLFKQLQTDETLQEVFFHEQSRHN